MNRRFFLFSGIAIVAGGSFAALSLPETEASTASPIDAEEHARAIAALAPPKRSRPVVAIIAGSRGGETTNFLVPVRCAIPLAGRRRAGSGHTGGTVAPDAGPASSS
jgi:hypothetical protein